MDNESLFSQYESLYHSLKEIIKTSEKRVLAEEPDELFIENVNFFVKSYLITICTYLEAYLQDIALMYANELNIRMTKAEIPHNFIYWKILGEKIKKDDLQYKNFDLSVSKDQISSNLSANPFKTLNLFNNLGVSLASEKEFENNKSLVNSVITKRNNIIHHNDKAIDISFSDLLSHIEVFLLYMRAIDSAVAKQLVQHTPPC